MIVIQGEDAVIQVEVTNISNSSSEFIEYDHYIECNLYYKNKDILFTSKNVKFFSFQLKDIYLNLNDLIKNIIETYLIRSERDVISINFFKDQYSSDFLLCLHFYLEWESDSLFQTKLRISLEQLQDFIKEIHYLMLNFKDNI